MGGSLAPNSSLFVTPRPGSLPSSSGGASTSPGGGADYRGCENGALMDSFGIFLQGLLGVVAFSLLMLKRFREPKHERRPWRIWFLDTSKQAIGMLFIHFANVYLSDLTEEDPCSLYLINFLLDATLGMLLIYAGVRAVSSIVEWQQWESLRFGEYGDPLQCSAWVGQCALYIVIMMFEKTIIIIVLLIPQWKESLPQVPAIPPLNMVQRACHEAHSSGSPDPFDVARGRCTDETSYAEESAFTDHVEGDDWSDYSDHEEDTSYRLFNTSDYQPLARRVVNTLGLQTAPSTSPAPAIKGAKVLKSPAPTEHYIPVPDLITKLASEEWAHPLKARRFKNLADRLYALALDFATKLDVPGIDEPIAHLVSRSLLPREGESHLKDTTERQIDFALRKNHEATTLAMRASASASIFSRASMMWLDDLLEDSNPDPVTLRRALLKLRKTAAFVADATLDATQLGHEP
ncbi:store-operated calcium entry regulator STIMATE isoform X3 [Rhineura floridana]|uniref:store-operated calcium entry regulator STIMATE isoform X3 n=1 Tax=Rhineura floridana TaxID=261503 RepID=UPI002AC7FBCE|nr:store-operated calcium entry regulator STIMATE isoform X3 [Rhineura floridana]